MRSSEIQRVVGWAAIWRSLQQQFFVRSRVTRLYDVTPQVGQTRTIGAVAISKIADAHFFRGRIALVMRRSLSIRLNPGTIFGVYLADPKKSARENSLQPGNKMVAGGYCLYSSSTVRMEILKMSPVSARPVSPHEATHEKPQEEDTF